LKHIEEEEPSDTSIVSEGRRCLLSSLEDIILGSEGISFAFKALLYCLAKNPNAQVKMRQEIYKVTQSGLPDTKANLPYCWSVIMETLRLIPQTGFGAPHHSDKTIYVDGFKIPVGTDVYPDLLGILRSTKYWKDPHDFQPERFIDENDQFKPKKQWIPFQIGARICPGKDFSLELLFRLALKVVTELKLSFDGFVEKAHEKSTDINNLRYLGMSLVHHHPFSLKVENHDMEENENINIYTNFTQISTKTMKHEKQGNQTRDAGLHTVSDYKEWSYKEER